MTEHIHHIDHQHDHIDELRGPFPPAEEDLYIDLVRTAQTSPANPHTLPAVVAPHVQARLAAVRARLGSKWDMPLDKETQESVESGFAARYEQLPTTHPLFEGQPSAHSHGEQSCGKLHGPIRKQLDRVENAVLGRVKSHTARMIAAGIFRLSALTICPGDDFAAIGLQVHSSIVGSQQHEQAHEEEYAILPSRPRIIVDFEAQDTDQALQAI